jgi:hypothetical protein
MGADDNDNYRLENLKDQISDSSLTDLTCDVLYEGEYIIGGKIHLYHEIDVENAGRVNAPLCMIDFEVSSGYFAWYHREAYVDIYDDNYDCRMSYDGTPEGFHSYVLPQLYKMLNNNDRQTFYDSVSKILSVKDILDETNKDIAKSNLLKDLEAKLNENVSNAKDRNGQKQNLVRKPGE